MQLRRACSICAQPVVLYPEEAQQAVESAVHVSKMAPSAKSGVPERAGCVPRTEDMSCMQGCSGFLLGFLTRSTFTGGRRMGFGAPDMVALEIRR